MLIYFQCTSNNYEIRTTTSKNGVANAVGTQGEGDLTWFFFCRKRKLKNDAASVTPGET
jgi:hypothetical protein